MKTEDLATRLIEALRDDTVLFAGAGCSAKVGIPVWADYLKHLALTAERYEPEVAALMRKRIDSEKFLAAAFLFKHELQAPEGDKWAAICAPFGAGTYSHEPLLPLVSLSFRAIVTTNFDSSLFDAWGDIATQRKIPRPQLLAREHTRGIAYISNFCLFLHGRASLPIQAENIVLDTKDYEQCYNDQAFTDGPLQLLGARTCLFVGFSFRDPESLQY